MALIKLNIADALLSESAAKKPSYKMAKISGALSLAIPSDKKAELQAIVGLLKKAKTAAVSGMSARVKAATAYTKANQTPKGPRKTALKETYKTEKAKSSADIKQAKALIKEANTHAKKHGLGGLNLPLSTADIVLAGPGLAKALKSVRGTKLTEFGVTGKRGTFKPKFVKAAVFDDIGRSSGPADRKVKPGAKKKTVTAAEIAKESAKLTRKKTGMTAGGVGGAHTPAKAKALKKKRDEQLGGKADTADVKLGAKVEKRSKAILRTVSAKADFSKASGTITNSEGKSLGNGAGVVVTEMRHHFVDKNIPIVRKKDGFEIPGVISITYTDKGATFKRLGK